MGGSAIGFTVSRNVSLAEPPPPSVTVKVIVLDPDWFRAGLTVTVLAEPDPPKEIFPFGTSEVFDEVADMFRIPAELSTSPTVKGIGPVEVSSPVL